ncbi:MAG: lamin tail domain-containing protein, partial [bacterium]|nr:lamin tail domain-containing protein [bacterium]
PVLDTKWAALQAAGVPVTSPNVPSGQEGLSIPDWIDQRRQFLLQQLAAVEAPFQITTNGGVGFSTPDSIIELEGTSPMSVHSLALDGVPLPVEWITVNSWRVQIVRGAGTHLLSIEGRDRSGAVIAGANDSITVTVSAGGDPPLGNLVINELMYHPAVPGAEFLELHNRSDTNAFDLSGWRVNGLGFTFAPGTVIAPGGYLVLAEDAQIFGAEYGSEIPLTGVYPAALDNAGEAISLLQPGAGGEEIEIDRVRFSPTPPWPAGADGAGASLQLIDPARDNARGHNWSAPEPEMGEPATLLPMTANWRYNQSGFVPVDWNQPGFDDANWPNGEALLYVESAALPAPKNTPLSLGPITYYFRTTFNYAGPGN